MTQLSLDVLFQHTEPQLVNDVNEYNFTSLCAADVSDAQLYSAGAFLDTLYGNGDTTRLSRATTPAFVRDFTLPPSSSASKIPVSFPAFNIQEEQEEVVESTSSLPHGSKSNVYDRLYPSLHKYQQHVQSPRTSHLCNPLNSRSRLSHNPITRLSNFKHSISKLTHNFQESSFLSAHNTSSKRVAPRTSTMPQSPAVDDVDIEIDEDAEYAIVVSMYEVYNDRIFDLLTASVTQGKNPAKRRHLLYKYTESSPYQKVVTGLRKVVCSNLEEALLVLETGLQERRVAGTGSNAVSSRSHGFFCVEVKKRHRGRGIPGPWTSSTMTIVDLAGKP